MQATIFALSVLMIGMGLAVLFGSMYPAQTGQPGALAFLTVGGLLLFVGIFAVMNVKRF